MVVLRGLMVCTWIVASGGACKTAPASAPAETVPADASSTPAADAPRAPANADNPARPADVPPAAAATLHVNELVGHPARWNGKAVVLIARLRYVQDRCTKSEPPVCTGHWQLLDAEAPRSLVLVLDEAIPVPAQCRAPTAGITAASPCAPQELDPARSYRIEGSLQHDASGARFVPTHIEAMP